MDQIDKGIQGSTHPLSISDHSIPADPVNSIRDSKSNKMETSSLSPSTSLPIETTTGNTTTAAANDTPATTTLNTTILDTATPKPDQNRMPFTSPKYASPPLGSGGKYIVKSKRAIWIDANACDITEAPPLSLPERLLVKQRKPSISDNGNKQQGQYQHQHQHDYQHKALTPKEPTPPLSSPLVATIGSPSKNGSDTNTMQKSGSPQSWLRSSRRPSIEQYATNFQSSLYSSSSSLVSHPVDYSPKASVLPKHRQKALHISTSSTAESINRHRTSSISSFMTDSSALQDDDDSSPCSSSTSYHPTTSISPMFINQDKGKSVFLHDHSPGSSSPLSCEISSSSSLRNNNKRRSSMTLLKNIPSSELANIINGYTGFTHSDTTGSSPMANNVSHPKQSARINTATAAYPSLSSTSSSSSSPSISCRSTSIPSPRTSSNNGINAYQHSLHSFFKGQLTTPKTTAIESDNDNSTNDRDIVEFDLCNKQASGPPLYHENDNHTHASTVYPALLLGGLGQDTDSVGPSSYSSRKPSLYINTSDLLHGSAPDLCGWNDTVDYFGLPVDMGNVMGSPLSAPGKSFWQIDTYDQYLHHSRMRKINKWCHISWNDSKTLVKIFLRHGWNNQKRPKLLIELPASEIFQDGTDLVNCIPWTNWMDDYQKLYGKPFKVPFLTCGGYDAIGSQTSARGDIDPSTSDSKSAATRRQQHNLSLDLGGISNGLVYNDDYHHYALDSSDRITTPTSADDSSLLSFRRISTSSSYLAGGYLIGIPPLCDSMGSVGYSFRDTGNRMGAFGRLGTILGGGGDGDKIPFSSTSPSVRIRHTIKTRLQSAKDACNNEIRIITNGLNKYVERGLRYVDRLEEDLEQVSPSDDSDDHDDSYYNDQYNFTNSFSNDKNDNIIDPDTHESNSYSYHPLQSITASLKSETHASSPSPVNELPPLSSPSSSSSLSLLTTNTTANVNNPSRRRSLAIRLQNIEEQTELSSSETDQSQVTTPSDERLPKQIMMKLPTQQTATRQTTIGSSLASLVPQNSPADLSSKASTRIPSRYAIISEDAYLPTPFILALQDLITLAQTVLDTPLEDYFENIGGCAAIVSAIQSVGMQWDTHPEWPCREWYVRLLLCVAALNRVLEWWEAERGFWCSWNTSSGGSPATRTHNTTTTNNASSTRNLPTNNTPKAALDDNDDMEMNDNNDDLDFTPRYRRPSETESAWSYMEPQDDVSLSRIDYPSLASMDYYYNSSMGGDYEQHTLMDGDESIKSGSALLQEAVRRGQSNTIVMELTLMTTLVQYLSPVWKQLIGTDSQDVIGKSISDILVPGDQHVFRTATTNLLQDSLRTVELRFSVQPVNFAVIEMEGKGMIMYNRVTGQPSHTMWVIKPQSRHDITVDLSPSSIASKRLPECSQATTQYSTSTKENFIGNNYHHQQLSDNDNDKDDKWTTIYDGNMEPYTQLRLRSISEPITTTTEDATLEPDQQVMTDGGQQEQTPIVNPTSVPSSATMQRAVSHGGGSTIDNIRLLSPTALKSLPPTLCRVCERSVVAAFFEQHSELCVELHRTEMDVIIWNDNLRDLKLMVQELLNKSQPKLKIEPFDADKNNNDNNNVKNHDIDMASFMDLAHGDLTGGDSIYGDLEQRLDTVAMCKDLLDILDVAISIPIPGNEVEDELEGKGDGFVMNGDGDSELPMSGMKSKMVKILYWRPPPIDDATFIPWIQDVEHLTKAKVDAVNRMRDRLEYNERVRLDFQQATQQDKGWTEYVDDEINDQPATSTTTHENNGNLHAFENTSNLDNTISTTNDRRKKTFIGKWKKWKSKSTTGITRMGKTRRQARKSRPTKTEPHIVEMETIETPLASPALSFKTHTKLDSMHISDSNHAKLQHRPLIPSSAASATSSSTNTTVHRSLPPTIKDYDIIKPISKGAFGSVFLAKKRLTGDYYAIKFLKKSDMIAKNQVTNVKAERMILMTQPDSPFVTKLYYTFQSKDYLYLVLEYLNGGDCSALIKVLGRLPEDWTRNYLAEVTLGLEYLYNKNIIHRDLKPDNLLIDQNGHLKLTDFGLSRIGFLDRRVRDELSFGPHFDDVVPQPSSMVPSRSNTPPSISPTVPPNSTLSPTISNLYRHSYFSAPFEKGRQRRCSYASSSAYLGPMNDCSPRLQQYQQHEQHQHLSHHHYPYHHTISYSSSAASTPGWQDDRSLFNWHRLSNGGSQSSKPALQMSGKATIPSTNERNDNEFTGAGQQIQHDFRAIGTPDYIAPESVLGTGHDAMVDWWALGVICYEFLYGYPPFNDDSPDKVFENILSRRIDWHEDSVSVSEEARDFMEKLMTLDPSKRLGANGPGEVKQHSFFKGIDWNNLLAESPSFVPQPVGEEDTTYFDARGATMQDHGLLDKESLKRNEQTEVERAKTIILEQNLAKMTPIYGTGNNNSQSIPNGGGTDHRLAFDAELEQGSEFGTFVYKNLPLLEKANENAIRKLRHDSIAINAASPVSTNSIESASSTPRSSTSGDGDPPSATNWFQRSLPAISRKKRDSIFDFAYGPNSTHRQSASSSLNYLTYTTSLPATPSNLSPSTSSKVISTTPSHIPTTPSKNINHNIKKDNKKSAITTFPSKTSLCNIPRLRSISSPGNRLFHMATGQVTSNFTGIMQDESFIRDIHGSKPSGSSEHDTRQPVSENNKENQSLLPGQHQQQHHHTSNIATSLSGNSIGRLIDVNSHGNSGRTFDCLLADDNPISCKILETILDRLHCRCVIVRNGAQAIRYAMGNVQFDLIFMDIRMPIIDGEAAARMIKSVENPNQNTPIIAVTAYEQTVQLADTFDDIVNKPITREIVEQRINFFCQRLDNHISTVSSPSHHQSASQESLSLSNNYASHLSTTQPIPIPPSS